MLAPKMQTPTHAHMHTSMHPLHTCNPYLFHIVPLQDERTALMGAAYQNKTETIASLLRGGATAVINHKDKVSQISQRPLSS